MGEGYANGEGEMTTREYWLTKVKAEMAKLEKNPASESAARELAAASQLLYDEMLSEQGKK